MWSGMDGTLVKRTNVINYPKSYVKVTTQQAKKLQRLTSGKTGSSQIQGQARSYVTAKVQAAMAKQPNMTAKQIQQVSQQAEQEFMGQMIKQALN